MKASLKGDIGLPRRESPEDVAPEIALLPGWSRRERGRIDGLPSRILTSIQLQRDAGHQVGTRIECRSVIEEDSTQDVDGRRRSGHYDATHRPATQNRSHNL